MLRRCVHTDRLACVQRPVSKDAQTPLGAVHAFRMSVWAEHLANGNSKEGTKAMMYPSTLESVRRVWELAAVRFLPIFVVAGAICR
jgi:hypothetical protein